jgi:hypothetical protein
MLLRLRIFPTPPLSDSDIWVENFLENTQTFYDDGARTLNFSMEICFQSARWCNFLPLQVLLSPASTYPLRQPQMKLPIVLVQIPLAARLSQLSVFRAHSSISTVNRSEVTIQNYTAGWVLNKFWSSMADSFMREESAYQMITQCHTSNQNWRASLIIYFN